jgi:hypothetical protein
MVGSTNHQPSLQVVFPEISGMNGGDENQVFQASI